jgi:fluoroacetyl-CoA thioesterase
VSESLTEHAFQNGGFDHFFFLLADDRRSVAGACCLAYGTGVALHTGLSAQIELHVTDGDTAEAIGSGSVPVLSTPRLVALCEEATCLALDGHLPPERTSVGKRVQFDHLVPVGVGGDVTAEATLDRIEGRRLTFSVSVSDSAGLVAAGKVNRVVVDRADFLANAR